MPDTSFDYFDQAYRTGSDIWSHIPYYKTILSMLPAHQSGAMLLELGSGRGLLVNKLVENGYRVLGVDYIKNIVDKNNADLKLQKMSDKARFVVGDARDIPFTDDSFDVVVSVGLLQHIGENDWETVIREIARVTKSGGYVLISNLSKKTPRFYDWSPAQSDQQHYEKFGVSYYFFTDPEIEQMFTTQGFELIEQQTETFESKSDPDDRIALNFSLFKK
ncbi:MAG: class I SAM-dependent methyltransferase [Candidatus Nomurabacteria bacterium]|nr:class I SAM-dependent methyltransferase [Candidatus Nomurabacteria bacterium]